MPLSARQLIFASAYVLFLLPSSVYAEWYQRQEDIMGTAITAEVWDTDKQHAKQCMQQVMAEMHRINELMSPFREDTALAKINREASQQPIKIPVELFNLIKKSLTFSNQSNGAFDISFASAGYLYDYRWWRMG